MARFILLASKAQYTEVFINKINRIYYFKSFSGYVTNLIINSLKLDAHRSHLKLRSDLIETLHDELSMASDGMNTKRQIKRPIAGQKSHRHSSSNLVLSFIAIGYVSGQTKRP